MSSPFDSVHLDIDGQDVSVGELIAAYKSKGRLEAAIQKALRALETETGVSTAYGVLLAAFSKPIKSNPIRHLEVLGAGEYLSKGELSRD